MHFLVRMYIVRPRLLPFAFVDHYDLGGFPALFGRLSETSPCMLLSLEHQQGSFYSRFPSLVLLQESSISVFTSSSTTAGLWPIADIGGVNSYMKEVCTQAGCPSRYSFACLTPQPSVTCEFFIIVRFVAQYETRTITLGSPMEL